MPAPYTKKHFLEMSPREYEAWKEEQRQQELQRPGRDAIENVYPEEFLVPGLVGAAKRIKDIGAARVASNEKAIRGIKMPGEVRPNERFRRNGLKMSTLADGVKKTPEGYRAMSEQERILYDLREKEAQFDKKDALRKLVDVGGRTITAAGTTADDQGENSYRRGGKVKAHRGDGIAQRGRTKGRMILG